MLISNHKHNQTNLDQSKSIQTHANSCYINKEEKSKLKPFSFFGPTCDSNDFMRGPFLLPESINEGDYLQIEEMGAYSLSMKNNFNGFFSTPKIFIDEEK